MPEHRAKSYQSANPFIEHPAIPPAVYADERQEARFVNMGAHDHYCPRVAYQRRLERFFAKTGLSIRALAGLLGCPDNRNQIRRWRNGLASISSKYLERLHVLEDIFDEGLDLKTIRLIDWLQGTLYLKQDGKRNYIGQGILDQPVPMSRKDRIAATNPLAKAKRGNDQPMSSKGTGQTAKHVLPSRDDSGKVESAKPSDTTTPYQRLLAARERLTAQGADDAQ